MTQPAEKLDQRAELLRIANTITTRPVLAHYPPLRAALDADIITQAAEDLISLKREVKRLDGLINTPETASFLEGVKREAAHQRERWGAPHDREKSAEHWYWLVGYLAGKALRAAISGDKAKAQHHTISSAAALLHWHTAIAKDTTGAGLGRDADLQAHDDGKQAHETAPVRNA
jgi:hypothetical protein